MFPQLVALQPKHEMRDNIMDRDRIVTNISTAPQAELQQQLHEHRELVQAIQFLNRSADVQVLGGNNRFQYEIDSATRMPVVKVIQTETEDVIYQLPPDYVVELAREARRRLRASS